jgi:hypothetical protein
LRIPAAYATLQLATLQYSSRAYNGFDLEMETPPEPVGWADLPDEIVENVFETLDKGDYIRLGLVCTPQPFAASCGPDFQGVGR